MGEIRLLLNESLESGEFGPFLDWLDERGLTQLKARIHQMLEEGEVDWLRSVYFSHIGTSESLTLLDEQARRANQVLGRKV